MSWNPKDIGSKDGLEADVSRRGAAVWISCEPTFSTDVKTT